MIKLLVVKETERLLDKAKEYYKNREKARSRYRELSEFKKV